MDCCLLKKKKKPSQGAKLAFYNSNDLQVYLCIPQSSNLEQIFDFLSFINGLPLLFNNKVKLLFFADVST